MGGVHAIDFEEEFSGRRERGLLNLAGEAVEGLSLAEGIGRKTEK